MRLQPISTHIGRVDDAARAQTGLAATLRDRSMDDQGFIVVPGVLDAVAVERWRDLAFERVDEGPGFHTDLERASAEHRAENERLLRPLWDAVLPEVLQGSRVFMSSFLVKWPGLDSDLYVHQDSTYVDETRHRSVAVWVALDDADDAIGNGPLRVLPGSHRWADEYRGTLTEPWFTACRAELFTAATPVPVRAGDVVLMDNRLIHASGPNTSSRPRVAVAGAAIPEAASLRHAVATGDGRVGLLRVDDDFYLTHSPQGLAADPPAGPFFAIVPQRSRAPEPAVVRAVVGHEVAMHEPAGKVVDDDTASRPPDATGTGRLLALALGQNHRRVQRSSRHQPGPVFGADVLGWLPDLEDAAPVIRQEWDAAGSAGLRPLPMEMVSGAEFGADGAWDAVVLRHNGGWIDRSIERFPQTTAVLRSVVGLRAALFSVLAAGARIPPHRGANNGVLRVHLGLVVPGAVGDCHLDVGRARLAWEEGRAFAFDDSYMHSAVNPCDEHRVVLMLEVDRPLIGWAATANRLVQNAFTIHPQVRGASRRIAEVDEAANAGLRLG